MKQVSRFITKFCYNHPRFGIPRLPLILVAATAVTYLFSRMDTTGLVVMFLQFDPEAILRGQIWRLVSWVFLSYDDNLFYTAISLYFTYVIGTALEGVWETGKLTIFYLSGVVMQLVVAFLMYFIFKNNIVVLISLMTLSAVYINLSLFFAYASVFPDNQIMLFFIIPLKAKWLAWAMAAWYGYNAMKAVYIGLWAMAVPIFVAAWNYVFIVGLPRKEIGRVSGSVKQFKNTVRTAREMQKFSRYLHKCVICGKTDVSDPSMEFRYCSHCEGYKCYCLDHINNHKHAAPKE